MQPTDSSKIMPLGLPRQSGVLGTGLLLRDLLLLTVLSVTVFLVYPTLLWRCPPGSAHLGRIVVSYLMVVPFATAIMAWRNRAVDPPALLAAILLVWSVKLLLTVALYHGLAEGLRAELEPPAAPHAFAKSQGRHYKGVVGFRGRNVSGRVGTQAIVVARGIDSGKPLVAQAGLPLLSVDADGLHPTQLVVTSGASIGLVNRGTRMTVIAGSQGGRTQYNIPVVPQQSPHAVTMHKPGLVRFVNRLDESATPAWVHVLEHPYYQLTDAEGHFRLEGLPTEPLELAFWYVEGDELKLSLVKVAAGGDDAVELSLAR
ncbi:MAG: hypothetical protein ACE5E4_08910 [Candidatus Binatia bacterium]